MVWFYSISSLSCIHVTITLLPKVHDFHNYVSFHYVNVCVSCSWNKYSHERKIGTSLYRELKQLSLVLSTGLYIDLLSLISFYLCMCFLLMQLTLFEKTKFMFLVSRKEYWYDLRFQNVLQKMSFFLFALVCKSICTGGHSIFASRRVNFMYDYWTNTL